MLTFFTTPRAFEGHFNIIQRNAIKSWTLLRPKCEVILFGDEKGVAEVAAEFGVRHFPEIKKNEFGTPILGSTFNLTKKIANNNLIVPICGDIILMSDFTEAVKKIKKDNFLMVGRRWDLNVKEEINFNEINWEKKFRRLIFKEGKLHGFSGIDYFVFPKNLESSFPPFIIGSPGWDNWLIYRARTLGVPVIDATEVVTIVHQNHDRPRKKKGFFKKEKETNFKLAGGFNHMCTLRDADWVLTLKGLRKPPFPRRIFATLSLFPLWRFLISIKRKIQKT